MPTGLAKADCRVVDAAELKAALAEKPEMKEIIFFAAWCKDCKDKLAAAGERQTVVAVFEDKERAERVWRSVNKTKSPCFVDRDDSIAKAWGVSGLPFSLPL